MNLPNVLAFSRILLTFLIMAILFVPSRLATVTALVLFMVAAFTDWLDGFIARRWKQATPFGALLDPIADKILVLGMFLIFVQMRLVPAWMVLIIMFRELLITGVRMYAVSKGVVLAAAKEGKNKTASQMLTITLILMLLVLQASPERAAAAWIQPMHTVVLICLWITMLLTVTSGASFFWHNRHLFDVTAR